MTAKSLVARKIGMTRMMSPEGQLVAVTLLKIEDQKVTKVLSQERDGYNGYQVGYYPKAEKSLTKADLGRLRKVSISENFARYKEFRLDAPASGIEMGSPLTASLLDGVTSVDVVGITKGRGFTGSIKRWNCQRGRMTHGSMYHRRPGSLGCRTTPGRVFKNKPVPGHYGDEQVTIQNLRVMDIDAANNVIALCGSVPGHRENFLFVSPSIKA